MPIFRYPVCHRGRHDCEPIHCIASEPDGITEEQLHACDYEPLSFVCSGCASDPVHEQDKYRLCFKNPATDEISDNDLQDLTSIVSVVSAALNLDAVLKVSNGIIKVPSANEGAARIEPK